MIPPRQLATYVACCLPLVLVGCDSSATVEGIVTFDGLPVESGAITFLPADGQGMAAGGLISSGAYSIPAVAPGAKIVQIDRSADVPVIRNSGDLRVLAPQSASETEAVLAAAERFRSAIGNNAQVTIEAGSQTLNWELTSPPPTR